MTKLTASNRFCTYVAECLRILYWAYFKPYSITRWLHGIHPQLKPTDNPWELKAEFLTNHRLSRYAGQVWRLCAVVPLVTVLAIGLIYSLTAATKFNWWLSGIFLWGWLCGLWLGCSNLQKLKTGFQYLVWIGLGLLLIFMLGMRVLPQIVRTDSLSALALSLLTSVSSLLTIFKYLFHFLALGSSIALGIVVGAANGVAIGVAVGIAGSVAFGGIVTQLGELGLSVTSSIYSSVIVGVVIGLAGSLLVDIASGVIGAIAGTIVGILAGSTIGGIAFGMATIGGVLRIYFWIPEFLWLCVLWLLSRQGKEAKYLAYLPPWCDQLIRLPLPLMDNAIANSYRHHPIVARRTLDYLLNLTNQQKVAATVIANIAVNSFQQCQTLSDITKVSEELAWIPTLPAKGHNWVLLRFLEVSQNVLIVKNTTSGDRQIELLALAINSLSYLWHQLLLSNEPKLSQQYSPVAKQWLRILQTTQRKLEAQVR